MQFSKARQEVIRCAEALGNEKVVPRDPSAWDTDLRVWCRVNHAAARAMIETRISIEDAGKKFNGMDLRTYRDRCTHLRDAIEVFAKELGMPENFWL